MTEELYQGEYDKDEDFAYQLADDLGLVPEGNDWPTNYIDWVIPLLLFYYSGTK